MDTTLLSKKTILRRWYFTTSPDLKGVVALAYPLNPPPGPHIFNWDGSQLWWLPEYDENDKKVPASGFSGGITYTPSAGEWVTSGYIEVVVVDASKVNDALTGWPASAFPAKERLLRTLSSSQIPGYDRPVIDVAEILGDVEPPEEAKLRYVTQLNPELKTHSVAVDTEKRKVTIEFSTDTEEGELVLSWRV